eukprot:PhM_4_TR16375/c0_g1_i1/m.77392
MAKSKSRSPSRDRKKSSSSKDKKKSKRSEDDRLAEILAAMPNIPPLAAQQGAPRPVAPTPMPMAPVPGVRLTAVPMSTMFASPTNAPTPHMQRILERQQQHQAMQQHMALQQQQAFPQNMQQPEEEIDWSCRIYVGSIHFEATETALRDVFQQYVGPVKFLSLQPDPTTGHHRGFCFIEFYSPEHVEKALALPPNAIYLMNRPLKIGRPTQAQAAAAGGSVNRPPQVAPPVPPPTMPMSQPAQMAYPPPGAHPVVMNPMHAAMGMHPTPSIVPINMQYPTPMMPPHGVPAAPFVPTPTAPPPAPSPPQPSRVVVISQMILSMSEDVDMIFRDYLTPEVVKFGPIKRLVLYEERVPGQVGPRPPKVIVEYEEEEYAVACQQKLDKRMFGQRMVRCQYLPEDTYKQVAVKA